MAFCSNCGAEIAEGAKFCPSCGTAVNGQAVSAVADSNSQLLDKENSLNELSKMYEYFDKKRSVYDEWNYISYSISDLSENGKKKLTGKFYMYGGIAIILIIVSLFLLSLLKTIIGSEIIELLKSLIPFLLILLSFVGLIRASRQQKKKIRELTARKEVLRGEINEYYNNYGNCPIGIEYTFPKDIEHMIDIIRSGRATKLSDALNMMLDDYHKQTVEENVRVAAINSAEAARHARAAADSASKAARSAADAEWNSRW